MRKVILGGIAVLAIAAFAVASNDPWKDKPYQQWDQKDIQKIFQNSPWSKTVTVDAKWQSGGGGSTGQVPASPSGLPSGSSAGGGGSSPGGGGRPGMGGGGGGPSGGGAPSGGEAGGGVPQAPFVVRWLSSRTMREAFVRSAVLGGKMTESDAAKDLSQTPDTYQVMVVGPQMNPFQSLEEAGVKQNAFLIPKKSKEKIEASKVEFQRSPDGKTVQAVIIAFPKKTATGQSTIGADEKGAEFSVVASNTTIKTSFDFSKMHDAQGPDL
jgi:hypothetical protein